MNIDDLRLFAEVLRTGGFSSPQAGGDAPLSAPGAIDALTRDLEARVAQDLPRAPGTEPDGEAFFRRVMPLIDAFDANRAEPKTRDARAANRLRITATPAFGQLRLAPLLAAFRKRRPSVEIDMTLTDAVVDLVESRIDLAVRHSVAADGAALDGSVVARRLAAVRHVVVASPDYLADASPLTSPAAALDHPCLTLAEGGARRRWRFRKDARELDLAIRPVLTLNDAAALRACALDGQGLTLLPDWAAAEDLAKGRLVEAFPGWEAAGDAFESSLWLVFPSRRFISSHAIAFADMLAGR